MKNRNTQQAFTLIELMVGIVLTVLILATFFRFFNHVTNAESNNTYKAAVLTQGEASLEAFANAARLIGLTSTYTHFSDISSNRIIQQTIGSEGKTAIDFCFLSPFGGPITKISAAGGNVSGTNGACTFKMMKTASISGFRGQASIITKNDIYHASLSFVEVDEIVTNTITTSTNSSLSGDCVNFFTDGNIITGPNYFYRLRWTQGGSLQFQRVLQPVVFPTDTAVLASFTGSTVENIFIIPPEQVPFVRLEFLHLLDPTATPPREDWKALSDIATGEWRSIKAVRIAIVILPRIEKDLKGASSATSDLTLCPFGGTGATNCITLNDISKPPMVFKKVIHLKNLDYLQRGITATP